MKRFDFFYLDDTHILAVSRGHLFEAIPSYKSEAFVQSNTNNFSFFNFLSNTKSKQTYIQRCVDLINTPLPNALWKSVEDLV